MGIRSGPPHGGIAGAGASGGGETAEEDEPLHVVDDVCHADLHRRPSYADGPDEEPHFVFLHREDVLDA